MTFSPHSHRFCRNCETITVYCLDKHIGHSRCLECGFSTGAKIDNPIFLHFIEESIRQHYKIPTGNGIWKYPYKKKKKMENMSYE